MICWKKKLSQIECRRWCSKIGIPNNNEINKREFNTSLNQSIGHCVFIKSRYFNVCNQHAKSTPYTLAKNNIFCKEKVIKPLHHSQKSTESHVGVTFSVAISQTHCFPSLKNSRRRFRRNYGYCDYPGKNTTLGIYFTTGPYWSKLYSFVTFQEKRFLSTNKNKLSRAISGRSCLFKPIKSMNYKDR